MVKFHILCQNCHFSFWIEEPIELNRKKYFELNDIFYWITTDYIYWIIFWIEFSWNDFESNIELNQFWAKFKHWIESIWVSDRAMVGIHSQTAGIGSVNSATSTCWILKKYLCRRISGWQKFWAKCRLSPFKEIPP